MRAALLPSCGSPAFEHAIRSRRHDAKSQGELPAEPLTQRVGDIRWVGIKARDLFRLTPRERYMEMWLLEDHKDTPAFYAPRNMEPDDYILTCEPPFTCSSPTDHYFNDPMRRLPFADSVLVLRASAKSGRYHVVGPAYETCPFDDIFVEGEDGWKHFIFWWDA